MVSPDARVCPEVVARDVAALSAVVLTWRSRGRTPELGTRVGAFVADARGVAYARLALNEGGCRRKGLSRSALPPFSVTGTSSLQHA